MKLNEIGIRLLLARPWPARTWRCVSALILSFVAHFCVLLPGAETQASAAQPAVRMVKAPAGCFVPDVAVDAKGVLHMVYALNLQAYYIQSADNGTTFTAPVQVNSAGTVCFKMGERGPKLAVGSDGVIHVVWADQWSPEAREVYARYSRSLDGGKTFEPRKTVSSMTGTDGLTMAADGKGNVLVFWHTMQPVQKEIPQATWIHLARSRDNGANFSANEHVKINNARELACSMCLMRARIAGDQVFLAYRGADNNLRDFWVLKGPATANDFTAIRVNQDNWELKTCPMCGPELTLAPDGRQLCAFMSRHKVYWAISDQGVSKFDLHVATPANENDEIYPAAIANRQGQVLFLWQVGPMATDRTATVKWARYRADGEFAGEQGTIGATTSGTKPTAFVGIDDNFYIVTTAR